MGATPQRVRIQSLLEEIALPAGFTVSVAGWDDEAADPTLSPAQDVWEDTIPIQKIRPGESPFKSPTPAQEKKKRPAAAQIKRVRPPAKKKKTPQRAPPVEGTEEETIPMPVITRAGKKRSREEEEEEEEEEDLADAQEEYDDAAAEDNEEEEIPVEEHAADGFPPGWTRIPQSGGHALWVSPDGTQFKTKSKALQAAGLGTVTPPPKKMQKTRSADDATTVRGGERLPRTSKDTANVLNKSVSQPNVDPAM